VELKKMKVRTSGIRFQTKDPTGEQRGNSKRDLLGSKGEVENLGIRHLMWM